MTIQSTAIRCLAPAGAETAWQFGAQYADPWAAHYEVVPGYFAGNDLNAALYPLVLGLLAWQGARYFWDKKDDKREQTCYQIGRNIMYAMAGWTVAYYVAEDAEWGRWGMASAVGVGLALPSLILNSAGYMHDPSKHPKANIAVWGAAMFAAGFLWYVDYLIPSMIGGNEVTQECMKSIVSPAMTLLTTALCVFWGAVEAEKRIKSSMPGR